MIKGLSGHVVKILTKIEELKNMQSLVVLNLFITVQDANVQSSK